MTKSEFDSKTEEVLVKGCTYAIALPLAFGVMIPILTAYVIFAYGYVGTQLWQWFMVEPFNLPQLSVMHFAGIALFKQLYGSIGSPSVPKETKSNPAFWFLFVAAPWITLLTGYILHLNM